MPCGHRRLPEAFTDPDIRARGMVIEIDHPTLGTSHTRAPVQMSETPPLGEPRATQRTSAP